MKANLHLQKIILERTEALRQYALKPNANEHYINKENAHLEQLTQIFNGLGDSLIHHNLWKEVEEAWFFYQKSDTEFSGITPCAISTNGFETIRNILNELNHVS